MKQLCYINISVFLFVLLTGCASLSHVDSGIFGVETDNVHIQVAFGDHDRNIINNYYLKTKMKRKGLPPGLAKKGKLPPGLQKQLKKNRELPPGLAKRHLPYDLEERLSPLPRGYVRLKVGGDIVLMDKETDVIVDIIYDVG
jgi:hypothetical protein